MRSGHDILGGVERIMVLKAGGLGDIMFALPALDALRATYPTAEITLLTSAAGAELFAGRPPVDRVLAVPPFEGEPAHSAEGRATIARFLAARRAEAPDLAVQLHGGGANSNPFVRGLGARVTAGLQAPDAPPLDHVVPYVYLHSEVLRCLEVVSLAGASAVALEPRLCVRRTDLEASRAIVPDDDSPLAVIHPGAGDPLRRWSPRGFIEVGRALTAAGARVVVTATEAERAVAREVAEGVPAGADLTGRLSLPALAGLLARAAVVVSNDSGPLHLAAAVGAATVGVYWCGNVVNAGPATAARHRVAVSWRLDCPVCGADCTAEGCAHDASFVADVPVPDVLAPALEFLSAGASSGAVRADARGDLHLGRKGALTR